MRVVLVCHNMCPLQKQVKGGGDREEGKQKSQRVESSLGWIDSDRGVMSLLKIIDFN